MGYTTRAPAVAGYFYPAEWELLSSILSKLFADSERFPAVARKGLKALIVPHAGYIYSGPIAAAAYRLLLPQQFARVVLIGPSHRVAFHGIARSNCSFFSTPLGKIPVEDCSHLLEDLEEVVLNETAHEHEHALEVQLPFLQWRLGSFSLIPLVIGQASAQLVGEVLHRLWGDEQTLIVVSSDLSHYLPYVSAQQLDKRTCDAIASDQYVASEMACGATAINGLLAVLPRHPLDLHLLDCRNSGDTAGEHDRVVGYAAFAGFGKES